MAHKRNILVFPAATEIGLEILNSLRYCKEVKLFAAGQDSHNHARFAYPEYHVLPSIHEDGWLEQLVELCMRLSIDYIFPAYDDVIVALAKSQSQIPCRIISPSLDACLVTRSKSLTYQRLGKLMRVPAIYETPDQVPAFPVFVKPDRGQGSYAVAKVNCQEELIAALKSTPEPIICEYLPGEEYTVDCFSDRDKGVQFAGIRLRRRTRNGISVNTVTVKIDDAFALAQLIHDELGLWGAWFFQLKRACDGSLALLEVAPRIAGSMATHRVMGVNFPILSIYEQERLPLRILTNSCEIELDRALCNRYRHNIKFGTMYVDYDDTLLHNGKVNTEIVKLIFQCLNEGKRVKLLTRHQADLTESLAKHRLLGLFDDVIHLLGNESKSDYISESDAIFIDDSFAERYDVSKACGIPTFDCSMVELLTQQAESMDGVR